MGIHTSAQSWVGFKLWTDDVESFFEREDGRTVQELAEEVLSSGESAGGEECEEESDSQFFSEEGRFYDYLQQVLSPYPEIDLVMLFGGNFYTDDKNWCGISLKGLNDTDCEDKKFKFTKKQKEGLETIKSVLESVGFKLDDYSLHCAITVA